MSEFTIPEKNQTTTPMCGLWGLLAALLLPPLWLLGSWLLDGLPGHPLWQRADQMLFSLDLGTWHLPLGLFSLLHLLVGMGLVCHGCVRIVQSSIALRRVRTSSEEPSRELLREGPYAKVRHPMYSGFILNILGIGFALRSPWTLGLAVLLIVVQVFNGLIEERRLIAQFGAEYSHYARMVPERFFGGAGWALVSALLVWSGVGIFA